MVKYLTTFEDDVVLQKLDYFSKRESEICSIISNKISDLDKKNKYLV